MIVANGGLQTFNIVTTTDFVNTGSHLLDRGSRRLATSSGTIDLQNAGDFTAGSRRAATCSRSAGQDFDDSLESATFGGVAIADGAGNITGVIDENDGGVRTQRYGPDWRRYVYSH